MAMRRATLIAGTLLALLLTMVPTAPAQASAGGCRGSGLGRTCAHVEGSKLYVRWASVTVTQIGGCTNAHAEVTGPTGYLIVHYIGGRQCSGYGRVFNINRSFPNRSTICLYYASYLRNVVCFLIHN